VELLEDRQAPAVLTVNSTADTASHTDPYLSLREAVAIVNSATLPTGLSDQILGQISGTLHSGGADTIGFDPTAVTGPIVLSGTQLELSLPGGTSEVTIDGGAGGVTVDGSNASRVLQVDVPARLTLAHLTVTHGRAPVSGNGGGILNSGTLTVSNSTLSANSAVGGEHGGGIYNASGELTVTESILSDNTGGVGGALFNASGTLTVTDSTLSGNSATGIDGGGIYVSAGTATVAGSTLDNNYAVDDGGGVANNGGAVTVTDSTLSDNFAMGYYGGGVYTANGTLAVIRSLLRGNASSLSGGGIGIGAGGTLTVTDSTLAANSAHSEGGGLYNQTGTLAVSGCTLSANSASGGGGIDNYQGTVTVTGSTLSANSTTPASGYGGGIDNSGTLTVSSSTLSGNSATTGGGIDGSAGTLVVSNSTLTANSAGSGGGGITIYNGTLVLLNTLVAGNRTTSNGQLAPDVYGPVASTSSNNLIGIGDPLLSGISDGVGGNLIGTAGCPIDPRLGPLADNGGPTLTHALLPDSPARGAGSPTNTPPTDQRGLPRVVGGEIDIGSFQTQDAVAGPRVVGSNPGGVADWPVDRVRLTFNHPIDPATFTPDQASLTGPAGPITLTAVTAVPSTNDQQFDLSFASQADPGDYALAASPAVLDVYGNPLDDPTPRLFTVVGAAGCTLTVNSTRDTAHDSDPYLTLREAIALVNSPTLPDDLSPEILAQISGPLHSGGADTIAFDLAAVTGPIVLGGTQLELSLLSCIARVAIDGGGVTVDRNNASRVLTVDSGAWVAVDDLTVLHGRVSGTGNGGGVLNAGTLLLTDSTISGCSAYGGGGIANTYGSLTVSSSTVSLNSAMSNGGGIDNTSGTLTVSNSTLSSNVAGFQWSGGGIDNVGGVVRVSSSTLYGNSAAGGGGIGSSGTLLLRNTIVAGDHASRGGPDIWGAVDGTSSYNLIGNSDYRLTGISNGVNHNRIGGPPFGLDPGLRPLGDYGVPTPTMPLLAGSSALDTGDPSLAGTLDQRGVARSGGVNVGAFQASAAYLVVSAPDTATAGVAFDVRVSAFDPYGQPAVGYTGTVSFSSADPHVATLPGDYTFTLADAGSHTFAGLTTLYTAGTWDVTATDAINNLSGSANVNVVAGSAVAFVVTGPTQAVAGTPFDVTVAAVDAFGNVASGYTGTITFGSDDPAAGLPADYAFQPADQGSQTFTLTLGTPGTRRVTVTDTLDPTLSGFLDVTVSA
jgi:hypothetical protein